MTCAECSPDDAVFDDTASPENRVSFPDHLSEKRREACAYPMRGGDLIVLTFRDADGQVITAALTPALVAGVRAALALADLGDGVRLS